MGENTENKKLIRFISSDYQELFRIPDKGSIKITYPPHDGRGTVVRTCKHVSENHFELLRDTSAASGEILHICQFTEAMERIGARYEPEIQLKNVEITPFVAGDEKFFIRPRADTPERNAYNGQLGGSFGNSGNHIHYNCHGLENDRDTFERLTEFDQVVYALRKDLLKDFYTMTAYCKSHPEAELPRLQGSAQYGFKLETDARQYFVRCSFTQDSMFIIYAYNKDALMQIRDQEKPSVLKQIRDAKKAPKAPRKTKSADKHRGGAEL